VNDEKALTTTQQSALALMPVMALEDAIRRRRQVVQLIKSELWNPEVDSAAVPGTDKPTLRKPGAEKLTTFFGLAPKFLGVESILDWTGQDHGGEALFHLKYNCRLWYGDRFVAEGLGSCNSWESKYRYRKSERVCPECGTAAIIKGKAEYGGGWLCWGKRGGCGAKFKAGNKAIEEQATGRVLNPDVADLVNTIDKMAQKRALIAATLLAVNASEFFTQDLDDYEDVIEGEAREVTTTEPPAQETRKRPPKPEPARTVPNGGAKAAEAPKAQPLTPEQQAKDAHALGVPAGDMPASPKPTLAGPQQRQCDAVRRSIRAYISSKVKDTDLDADKVYTEMKRVANIAHLENLTDFGRETVQSLQALVDGIMADLKEVPA